MQTNVIQQFTTALLDAGIQTNDHIIDDGALHRFHVIGDKKGTRNGAYILHNDAKPSGWFQHFNKKISTSYSDFRVFDISINKHQQTISLLRFIRTKCQKTRSFEGHCPTNLSF